MATGDVMKSPLVIPLGVMLERREVARGRWSVPSWRALAVVAGEHLANSEASAAPLPPDDAGRRYLWTGVALTLYRDKAECYWHNLIGERPALYVICQQNADDELCPTAVTADPYEAGGHVEGDDQVFTVDVPPEVYRHIEAFVVEYNAPQPSRKRRRKKWVGSRGSMSERESRPAPPPGTDSGDDESFLGRWARRKTEAHEVDGDRESVEDAAPTATEAVDEAAPLTDEDMPPLGELDQDSDYSPFLAAGVSPALRRKALRQLFRSPKFNVVDGLDDYCEDLTTFEPLGDIVTADMKARAEALIRDKLAGDQPPEGGGSIFRPGRDGGSAAARRGKRCRGSARRAVASGRRGLARAS